MPTEPLLSILDRDYCVSDAKRLIDLAAPLLREVVNHGTWVFRRCEAAPDYQGQDEVLAPLCLYRHLLEIVDGIEVLFSQGCGPASTPLLRSAFEAKLGLMYVTRQRSPEVGLAWLVCYVHQRLQFANMAKTELQADWASQFGEHIQVPSRLPGEVAALEGYLSMDHIRPVEQEYQRLKAKQRQPPNWYSFYGGPQNLRVLAERVGRTAEYKVLYPLWSRFSHATDFTSSFSVGLGERAQWLGLRHPGLLREVATYAIAFVLEATRVMLQHFRPGENLWPWYEREVRTGFRQLRKLKVIINNVET